MMITLLELLDRYREDILSAPAVYTIYLGDIIDAMSSRIEFDRLGGFMVQGNIYLNHEELEAIYEIAKEMKNAS